MLEAGGQGGQLPPQILAAQKAPPAAAAARQARRLTTCPPRFLDFATCLFKISEGERLKFSGQKLVISTRVSYVKKEKEVRCFCFNFIRKYFAAFRFYFLKLCKKQVKLWFENADVFNRSFCN